MNRLGKILQSYLLISVFIIGMQGTALADKVTGNQRAEIKDALIDGADRMLSYQGTDGGAGTWPWNVGNNAFYWNVQGISAQGLVKAYEVIKYPRYLAGATATGDVLVERYYALTSDGVHYGDRPYSSYVEFLADLSWISGNPKYGEVAVKWYSIIPAFETAGDLVERYIKSRKSLAGWDLSSQIRAAVAAGNMQYARAIADEVVRRKAEWAGIPYGGWDYTILSYASLLWALDQVHAKQDVIDEFRSALLAAQADDGSWDDGSYQTTAYAILGLSANKGKNVKSALDNAAAFLVNSQSDNGGWEYPGYGEYAEEDSEVLMSLAALLKGGEVTGVRKAKIKGKPFSGKPAPKQMR